VSESARPGGEVRGVQEWEFWVAAVVALLALGALIGALAGMAFRIQKDERAFRRDMNEARNRAVRDRRDDMLV
jgi:hypothetical protein